MTEPQALIFDMDGTLVDNMKFQYEAWQRFFSLHRAGITLDETKSLTAVGLPRLILTDFFREKLAEEAIGAHLDRKEAFFQDLYGRHIAPIKGLPEFLRRIAGQNLPIALATGSDYRNVDYTLDKLKIRHYFREIVDADDVARGKPDPESFLIAAEKLRTPPQNCLVFEDSRSGIEAARRAGMPVVALTTLHSRAELIKLSGVVAVIDDYADPRLKQIPRASFAQALSI